MKVERDTRYNAIRMVRDESDTPVVPEPVPYRKAKDAKEFNSWRTVYSLSFDTAAQADKAFEKVKQIGDFDKAAAWLDKQ